MGFRQAVRQGSEETVEYLIPTEAFKNEVCKGYDAKKLAQELAYRGHLRNDAGRLQVQQRIPGTGSKAVRFYAIQSSILSEDGEADGGEEEKSEAA